MVVTYEQLGVEVPVARELIGEVVWKRFFAEGEVLASMVMPAQLVWMLSVVIQRISEQLLQVEGAAEAQEEARLRISAIILLLETDINTIESCVGVCIHTCF